MPGTLTDLVPLARIASKYPGSRGSDSSHPATWTRWILKGVVGVDGRRHKLAATRFGSRWMLTEKSVQEFFAALTATPNVPASNEPKPAERRRAVEEAARTLEQLGA